MPLDDDEVFFCELEEEGLLFGFGVVGSRDLKHMVALGQRAVISSGRVKLENMKYSKACFSASSLGNLWVCFWLLCGGGVLGGYILFFVLRGVAFIGGKEVEGCLLD